MAKGGFRKHHRYCKWDTGAWQLKVDSIKMSSWNPKTNDYVKFEVIKKPREDGAKTDYDTIPRYT